MLLKFVTNTSIKYTNKKKMKFVLNVIKRTQITNSLFLTNYIIITILISKSEPLKTFCKQI